MTKRPTRSRWTDEELDTLYRLYPRRGAQYVAKRLGRTPPAVSAKAQREGITIGIIPGRITITELAAATGRDRRHMYETAKRAGVLKSHVGVATVPEPWATKYEHAYRSGVGATSLAGTWFTTADAARELGMNRKVIERALRGIGSTTHLLAGAEVRVTHKGRRYIHPTSVLEAKERLRKLRAWMTFEDIARAWGCTHDDVSRNPKPGVTTILNRIPSMRLPAQNGPRVFRPADVHAATAEARAALGITGERVAA